MSKLIILNINNSQYFCENNSFFYINSFKRQKKEINIKNILLYKNDKKIYIGYPYIINLYAKLSLIYHNSKKKTITKFQRRKRYKIIKNVKEFIYKAKIIKTKWLKRKQ
ncbi:bL21 family ribosomal protein [Candidatus Vidania fulgoroideorum]